MNRLFYREIKPQGWLKRQLEIQARGLSGNLDKIWPDIRDSAWIGGDREGWERVPYWLDGVIPLAHLLGDADLIARANAYVQCIIDRQQPDGWICPCSQDQRSTYDAWAVLLIGKVLALHCEFTEDSRAEDALYHAMKNLHELLRSGKIRLFDWGKFRWFEGLIPLLHLYQRKPEPWMLELGRVLRSQGADYSAFIPLWKRPMNKWTFETHIVNVCMMLKYEALTSELLGEPYTHQAEMLFQALNTYNGTAVGTFTGDECLSGLGNQQGTELCAVVEMMYACEWLYAVTGQSIWAERLEKIAFNALPATFTDDMWAHQYDQMVNQVACITFPGKSFFRTNNSEAHLFGLEPHFGCCTANMHQGWPKLALHALQRTKEGIVCAHLLPVQLDTQIDGKPVHLRINSDYPFRMQAEIVVEAPEAVGFELCIRIPAWARDVRINGKRITIRDGHIRITRSWQGVQSLCLTMQAKVQMAKRPNAMKVVEYGALVFALPIECEYRKLEYTRDGVERKFPYCDYELIPHSDWRFGFADQALTVTEKAVDAVPFSSTHPPLCISAHLAPIHWDWADGYDSVPDIKPRSRKAIGKTQTLELIPYGCAKLRMTEMPMISKT